MVGKTGKLMVAVAAMVLFSAGMARQTQASLIGDTVTYQAFAGGNPFGGSLTDVVADSFIEFTFAETTILDVDISGSSITLTRPASESGVSFASGFNITLSGLDWFGEPSGIITGASVTSSDLLFGTASVTFSDHEVVIDIGSTGFDTLSFVTVELQTSHDVPEPATLAIFGLGLAGLGFMRRRRAA